MTGRVKRRPLRKDEIRDWSSMLHVLFIDGLSMSAELSLNRIAFHGGTNLHLTWGSPRFSEDLDFLVSREMGKRIDRVMKRVGSRMQQVAAAHDPDLKIEIRDRTKDRDALLNYRIVMTRPGRIGQAMVKAEFWQVEDEYLNRYGSEFQVPGSGRAWSSSGQPLLTLSPPIPTATLDASFSDKAVALALRPHLKWRDLFDLWWIGRQTGTKLLGRIETVKHHASGYSGIPLDEGFRRFLDRDPEDIVAVADPDLKRWLPEPLWESLWPDGIKDMVAHARGIAEEATVLLQAAPESRAEAEKGKAGKRAETKGTSRDDETDFGY